MNTEKGNYNENEQLEIEEQSINEPLTPEEDEQLTLEKRQEEADNTEPEEVDDSYSMRDYYKENPIMR